MGIDFLSPGLIFLGLLLFFCSLSQRTISYRSTAAAIPATPRKPAKAVACGARALEDEDPPAPAAADEAPDAAEDAAEETSEPTEEAPEAAEPVAASCGRVSREV